MGTGYTRNDTPNNIADGNVINASDLDGEFDAVQAAFNGSTGHSHDGTTGEGPQIDTAGLADNAVTTAKITDANVTTAKINNGAVTSAKLDTNIQIAGTLGVTGETTLTTHLNMGDNDIIKLGDSDDLQIYHDSNDSYIAENGTGSLYIRGTNLILQDSSGNEYLTCVDSGTGGEVRLKHEASTKLATTATGIDVTGTATMDGLTVDGATVVNGANINIDNGYGYTWGTNAVQIYSNGSYMRFRTASVDRIEIDANANIVLNETGANADFRVESDSNSNMLFVNAGTNRVGIGESNPDNTLHVNSGAENTAFKLQSTDLEVAMQFQDSTGASYIKGRGDLRFEVGAADVVQMLSGETVVNNSSNDYDFRVESNDNTHALFVDAGNNRVGILNSSPSYEFDVTGTISASDGVLANKAALNISRGTFDGGSSNSDNMGLRVIGTGNDNVTGNLQTGIAIGEGGAGLFSFDEGGSAAVGLGFYTGTNSAVYERMVIKADGNGIIINDQSHDQDFRVESDSNSHMLFVDASANFVGVNTSTNTFADKTATSFAIGGGTSATTSPIAIIADSDPSVEGGSTILSLTFEGDSVFSSANYIHFSDGTGEEGRIHSTGGGSVTYATTSDRRVKENIRDTSSKIDDLKAIQVRDYELISDGSSHTGFIAQELHTVVPDAVSVGGDDVNENRWGVEYGKVTPLLVKALQEAIAKIEDLETRLAALEAN